MIRKRNFLHAMYLVNHLVKIKKVTSKHQPFPDQINKILKESTLNRYNLSMRGVPVHILKVTSAQTLVCPLQIDLRKSTLQNIFITYLSNFFVCLKCTQLFADQATVEFSCNYSVKREITCTDLWCSLHELFPI